MMKFIYCTVLLSVLCLACNQKNAQKIEQTETVEEVIESIDTFQVLPETPIEVEAISEVVRFKKTACYGKCPVYEVTIMSNGQATYHGKKFVEREGFFTAKLNPEKLALIQTKAKEYQYFSFANEYPEDRKMAIVDLPMTVTAIRNNDGLKEIKTRNGTPPALQDFQTWLEGLINEVAWEKEMD